MPRADYIPTIGLEVHCQVRTNSKMFCACPTGFGDDPNTNVCPVCMGLPGALPVLNKAAIEQTILAGLLLDCETPEISKWDRKNYFYPDMPKNYQISQFDLPLCIGGGVPLYDHNYPKDHQKDIAHPGKKVKLTRIHLEEDVAKSTHLANSSVIDFNRAGTPLMEIVSDPDIDSPEEAFAYLKTLQQILIYGGISDADMEKGQLRCDVNVSVRKNESDELGTKVELKNMNSISAVRRALHYELDRQCEELDAGIEQIQSTRRWDDDSGETQLMRTKEDAHDYRYFPDPDLLPVRAGAIVDRMRKHVPELPHEKAARYADEFGLNEYDAAVLTSDQDLAHYFEAAANATEAKPKKVANWVTNTLLKHLNDENLGAAESPVPAEKLAATVNLVESGQVSNNQAKEVFEALWSAPEKTPAAIAREMGFEPADTGAVDAIIDEVIAANPDKVEEIRGGNEKLVNFLTGQVMKASQGKANPKQVTESLRAKLL
ncbi:MAG: Asp-tRNA(Asn)/Glu-tRNA(Gln) amidotransferase subunit GatB [Akkermansiaceae bacterium]|nr:Asp-tRNA(Asn)/Glu-tRNA(Gln) amidotransferase subunit GatB [Akkermansiaceae bacterium]